MRGAKRERESSESMCLKLKVTDKPWDKGDYAFGLDVFSSLLVQIESAWCCSDVLLLRYNTDWIEMGVFIFANTVD